MSAYMMLTELLILDAQIFVGVVIISKQSPYIQN